MKRKHAFSAAFNALIFICAVPLIGVFASCASSPADTLYSDSATENNLHAAGEIEKSLVLQHAQNLLQNGSSATSGSSAAKTSALDAIKKNLDTLLASPSSDQEYMAYVYALYADYYLLKNDKTASRRALKTADNYNSRDEYAQLVHSRLLTTPNERCDYLSKLVSQNPEAYRLKAELGFVYTQLSDYTSALTSFDAALPFLNEEYTKLYGEKRNQSQKLYGVESGLGTSSSAILQKEKILLSDMAALAQEHTTVFDALTGTAKWTLQKLNEKLLENGWYASGSAVNTQTAARKDAALFLWHIIAGTNTSVLYRYSAKYAARGKSPISDVPLDTLYFDAVVGTVEEDIIPLADGKKFEPDKPVSGVDFYKWLKKADALR